eukprot:TRINITY_DN119_c0_g1_i5.p1 TRINITY_DN119_c0_g1~~TRINITY_DN119_c0_g1_i5.p1  ORF type:complete len:773 (-),score=224.70 TRINITY_DN119_c0_g1_i5:311-2629(-)
MSTPPIASSYLNQHRILPLFEGLTSLLVYSQPKDPRAFMIDALKKIKEKNAFPYRPQDLDFLFPALAAAPDEVATSTKPSVDAAATHQREHAPVSKGPAAGNAHGETPNAKPASRGKEEGMKQETPVSNAPAESFVPDFMQTPEEVEQVEQVAVKMQSVFRNKKFKKPASSNPAPDATPPPAPAATELKHNTPSMSDDTLNKPVANSDPNSNAKLSDQELAAAKIQATYRGHAVRKDIKEQSPNGPQDEPKKTSPVESKAEKPADANPSEDEAALKIQAAYRGHSVRKELKNGSQGEKENPSKGATPTETSTAGPSLNEDEAAAKIQAAYRGHSVRKELKNGSQNGSENVSKGVTPTETSNAGPSLDEDEAAAKIQAAYRGHSVRKELKNGSQNGSENVSKGVTPTETSNAGPSLDEDEAALKIQAAYRGHAVRKELKSGGSGRGSDAVEQKAEEQVVDESNKPSEDEAALKIQAAYRGHAVRKELKSGGSGRGSDAVEQKAEEQVVDESNKPSEDEAALKIQAAYRGHAVRKELKSGGSGRGSDAVEQKAEEQVVDDESSKPSDEEAATKIQSVYRGHRVRKEMQGSNNEQSSNTKTPTPQFLAPPGVDENLAATKIQAVYRGHNVRKTMPQGSFKAGVLMMDQQPEDAIAADADAQEKDSADAAGGDSNSDLDQAAIRIQAMYRGHIVRKQMVGIPESSEDAAANAEENGLAPNDAGEVIATTETTPGIAVDNIDNPDEAERAATRIQASYRGYRTRKELGKDKEEGQAE